MKTTTINKAILIATMSLTAYSAYAFDYSYELSGGWSKLGKGPNGTWYQEPFPHKIELQSPSMSFGIIYNKDEDSYWRSGYTYLGRGRSAAVATASDDNYAPDKPPTYCNGPCWDMSHWYGRGVVQGLYTGYVKYTRVYGVKVEGEVGAFVYAATWTQTIPDWKRCEACAPEYLQVKHKTMPYATPYVAIGVENVWVTYYHRIQAQGDKWPAVYRGPTIKVEYRLEF